MTSKAFRDLYNRSMHRDHPRLASARAIWKGLGLHDFPQCVVLGEALDELGEQFDDALADIVRRQRMRTIDIEYRCPFCDQANCLEAVRIVRVRPEDLFSVLDEDEA